MPTRLELEGLGFLALVLVIALLLGLVHYYRSEYKVIDAQYEGFKQTVEAQGKAAEAQAKLKETQNATQISAALSARDAALARMRKQTSHPPVSILPKPPTSATEPGKICFDRTALDAALQRFRAGVQGLVAEGDQAVIDGKAWVESWPR